MSKKQEVLNAINTNTFMVALNTYHVAYNELNKADLQWIGLATRNNTKKSDLKFLNCTIDNTMEALYGSVIDALSHLVLLYETNRLTKSDRYTVEAIFKHNMSRKISRKIIKRACSKSKRSCLNNLYKRYKSKVKITD